METIYKGHNINSVAMPDAETRRWWLRVSIVCPAAPGRPNREEKPVIVRSFFTEVDAEKAGEWHLQNNGSTRVNQLYSDLRSFS